MFGGFFPQIPRSPFFWLLFFGEAKKSNSPPRLERQLAARSAAKSAQCRAPTATSPRTLCANNSD